MPREYLKKATKSARTDAADVSQTVSAMLSDIEQGGEDAARRYATQLDGYDGPIVLSADAIAEACARVPQGLRDDITFARDNVRSFAEMQKQSVQDTHTEVGLPPAIIFAAHLCGADSILAMGGVQGIAAMTFGLFGLPRADILAGPGNQYVAEAKRILYGRVGIDMVAGPTDSLILADATADPHIVATDLVSQAEHGYNSPVWLVTDNRALAQDVARRVPALIATLPALNRENAEAAWRDYAEIILCDDREDMAACSDAYAPEHLTVQAADLDWWLDRLTCYGSLFLGEETTVSYGDKATGTNHVLPTSGAAKYTGGLSVHKYMKVVTWQRATRAGSKSVAAATARISRVEGMEGHARSADVRLAKYFPDEHFDLAAQT